MYPNYRSKMNDNYPTDNDHMGSNCYQKHVNLCVKSMRLRWYLTLNIQKPSISNTRESCWEIRLDLEGIYIAEDTIGHIRRKYVLEPEVLTIRLLYRNEIVTELKSEAITIDNTGDVMRVLAGISLDRTVNEQSTFYQRMIKIRSLQMSGVYTPYKPGSAFCQIVDTIITKSLPRAFEMKSENPTQFVFSEFFEPTTRRLRTDYDWLNVSNRRV